MYGTDTARVRESNRSSLEIFQPKLTCTTTFDDIVVGLPELQEAQGLCTLDIRDHEVAGTIGAGQIDSQPEVHIRIVNSNRFAFFIMTVGDVH